MKDLVVGAYDGKVRIFINEGTDTAPDFRAQAYAQNNSSDLIVPSGRSSPVVFDVDIDGSKDLLAGNTNGQILYYRNVGSDTDPNFNGYVAVEADGVAIDLAGTPRSRPSVCYWTGDGHFGTIDGYPDILVGAYDGNVHLYRGTAEQGDMDADGTVDLVDFARFAAHWRDIACGICAGADFTGDGNIDANDLAPLADNWLMGG
jgi:hypothetical protein